MKLPILAYGHRILREKCDDVDFTYPNLETLIDDMWDTMHNASGCGLAAPQIGHKIRLFIVDSKTTFENLDDAESLNYFEQGDEGITETFINAKITGRSDEYWEDDEGCLSIPGLTQSIRRSWSVTIEYRDRNFNKHIKTFSGATARMIQHEYDHIEGILFPDYLKPLAKKLMESKLKKISRGMVKPNYPMRFI